VLVEKNRLGGAWHNGGALAAQTLIAAADRVQAVRSGAEFGLKTVRPGVDFALLRAHLRAVTDAVAPLDAPERYAALGVRVIKGAARFVDRETVVVERADTLGPERGTGHFRQRMRQIDEGASGRAQYGGAVGWGVIWRIDARIVPAVAVHLATGAG